MANRFWKAQPVSGAIVSIASPPQIRLTVASTTGMTTGDVRTVFGVVGTTEANGTWTITVIDGTNIDLQGTTFANLYTSGGAVNGKWDTTNTNNWVSSSGGTDYGQTVPGSADTANFDGSSGGGTVTVNATISVTTINCGTFTGTLDFSVNNNNVTLSTAFNGSGSSVRSVNLGSGTFTLSNPTGTAWNFTVVTNLTFAGSAATINLTSSAPTGARAFSGGGLTYGTMNVGASGSQSATFNQANTFGTINITPPNTVTFPGSAATTTVTTLSIAGLSSAGIAIQGGNTAGAIISVPNNSPTISYASFRDITATSTGSATFTATNSFPINSVSGITFQAAASGSIDIATLTANVVSRPQFIGY